MRTLIGALLAVTALSPTLATAQGSRFEAAAQVGRDGPRDDGPGPAPRYDRGPDARGDRPDRGGRPGPGDRPNPGPGPGSGDRRDDDRRGPGPDGARPPAPGGDAERGRPGGPGDRPGDRWAGRGGPRGDGGPDGRGRPDGPDRRRVANDWRRDRLDARDDRRDRYGFADRAAWNRGWRGDDRYDWSGYRTAHRGAYRLPRYYAPGGGGYRRVPIGVGLRAPLWNRSYWIDDPYAYRLPDAYGPYRWVRYYDDALLVDLNDGRVVDAVYGIFW